MHKRKRERYQDYFEELAANTVRHMPVVMSCYGRLHPDATTALERIALQAGRRQGVTNYRALLRRTRAAVGVAVVTRAVAMARACLPKLGEEALQLFYGEDPEAGDTWRRRRRRWKRSGWRSRLGSGRSRAGARDGQEPGH